MQGKRLWIIQKTRDYPLRKSKKIAQKRISRPICLTEPLDDKQKKDPSPSHIDLETDLNKIGSYLLSHLKGSTIGVDGLNFSVRDGKRWNTVALAT